MKQANAGGFTRDGMGDDIVDPGHRRWAKRCEIKFRDQQFVIVMHFKTIVFFASAGHEVALPQINLPAQLPFGLNTPWEERGQAATPATASEAARFNPFSLYRR